MAIFGSSAVDGFAASAARSVRPGVVLAASLLATMWGSACADSPTILLVNVSGSLGTAVSDHFQVTVQQGVRLETVDFPPADGTTAISLPTSLSLLVEGADGSPITVCVTAMNAAAPLASGCAMAPVALGEVNQYTITLALMAATCGDSIIGVGEECEGANLGGETCQTLSPTFTGGTLACDASCAFDTSGCMLSANCGNSAIDAGEECDGADLGGMDCPGLGFAGGSLACETFCQYDDSGCWQCGNGTAEPGELCDGADLAGMDCVGLGVGFTGGTLACDGGCGYDTSGCQVPASCGDGSCDPAETCSSCSVDCGFCCGDGTCAPAQGEDCSVCPADCGMCPAACNDGACDPGEDCNNCFQDCGICPPVCGDGFCDAVQGEDCSVCPADCGLCSCGDGTCDTTSEDCASCPSDCCGASCGNGSCDVSQGESCATCPSDCCSGTCGNGTCETGEDCTTCPGDCAGCGGCGDGFCDAGIGESCASCPVDCGCGGLNPGDLIITEIMINPQCVGDNQGEWFEVFNPNTFPVDISNLRVEDQTGGFLVGAGFVVPPVSHFIFAASPDPCTAIVPFVDYNYPPGSISLSNVSDTLRLLDDSSGLIVDQVIYDPSWPFGSGMSLDLSMGFYDHLQNDSPLAWCSGGPMFALCGCAQVSSPGTFGPC